MNQAKETTRRPMDLLRPDPNDPNFDPIEWEVLTADEIIDSVLYGSTLSSIIDEIEQELIST